LASTSYTSPHSLASMAPRMDPGNKIGQALNQPPDILVEIMVLI